MAEQMKVMKKVMMMIIVVKKNGEFSLICPPATPSKLTYLDVAAAKQRINRIPK
jgi:hypothetical protein